jgi:hypothetical protein
MPVVAVLQSFLLVLGSALNPGALVVSAVYLAKERGARLETGFITGGLIIGALVGVVVLVLIRVTGLELPTNLTPRYGIRLGLGILALMLAAFLPWLRTLRRPGEQGEKKPNLSTRLMEGAEVGGAIVVGVLIFAPGVQYLAGVEGIAAAEPRLTIAVLLVLAAAVVNVALAWIFLAAFMRAPDRTQTHLTRANNWIGWVKNHRDLVIRSILAIVGVYLVINGTVGLASN